MQMIRKELHMGAKHSDLQPNRMNTHVQQDCVGPVIHMPGIDTTSDLAISAIYRPE